uniref:Myosin motor domain-containing protein n=1 Tax=Glossina pallidipes TaxID=7398 RepID=A0A1A9ZDB1_GLOPL
MYVQDCFYYLNFGRSPEKDKISDGEQFKEAIQAMQVLSLHPRQLDDLHLRVMRELLLIKADELRKWLLMRQIESFHELVLISNNKEIAVTERDALAKHIYAKLF